MKNVSEDSKTERGLRSKPRLYGVIKSKRGLILYLFEQIRSVHVDSTSSFQDVFGSIFAFVFSYYVTSKKYRDKWTSWETLFVRLEKKNKYP
jgi:hypothetical protein